MYFTHSIFVISGIIYTNVLNQKMHADKIYYIIY